MFKFHDISKSFGEVEVLKGITLSLQAGEILGLIGENGAGKSTMMNILGGIYQPSSGTMYMDGKPYRPNSALDAYGYNIAFIHQELNLFPNLTIAENLFINKFPLKNILGQLFLDKASVLKRTEELLARVKLAVSPRTLVGDLSPAQQQMVEIAKTLSGHARLIIFDEPTTALSHREKDSLFVLMNELRKQQLAMIYISHNLQDIKHMSDRIAVLRDGALISTDECSEYSVERMIREMVGRDLDSFFPSRSQKPSSEKALEVKDLTSLYVDSISFDVKRGEILGFYGLIGAGRSEMARTLFGLDKKNRGSAIWQGKTYTKFRPSSWIKAGVTFLTEDRRDEGLLMTKSILENAQLANLPDYSKFLKIVDGKAIEKRAMEVSNATKIKFHHFTEQEVSTLSGGNQQKVVLTKWLMTNPKLMILDEPTKGIDIGAKHEIYTLINSMVDQGGSALLISSEIEELLALCDRIIVMKNGRLTAEFTKPHFDKNLILQKALQSDRVENPVAWNI